MHHVGLRLVFLFCPLKKIKTLKRITQHKRSYYTNLRYSSTETIWEHVSNNLCIHIEVLVQKKRIIKAKRLGL